MPTPTSITISGFADALQGVSSGYVQFTRTNTTGTPTLNYSVSGTAQSGADYTALSGTVTFTSGSSTAEIDITPTSNPIDGPESVIVTEETGMGYSLGMTTSATVQIINLDAENETIGTLANTAITIQPPATEFGVADNAVTATSVTQGSNGSVTLNDDGTITYTPDTDFTGTDTFTYTVEDEFDNTATATITVDVSPVVTALSDTMLVTENTATSFPVLDLASDANSETLTTESVTQGANGSVSINDDGSVTYTPDTGFTGTDSFTYTVEDTDSNTATGTISVTVSAGPFALGGSASTVLNTAVSVPVLSDSFSPTGETLSVSSVTDGSDGSVSINDDGTVTYTPNTGFTGTDSFTYTVEDTDSNTATGTISVTVAPVISTTTDNVSTVENEALTIPVLDQATDANSETLTVESVTQGSIGSVTINDDGTVTYTPNSNAVGTDSFTYTVEDTDSNTATGTVDITVVPGINAPELVASTLENTAVVVPVTSQATDAQSETMTVTAVTQGSNGSVTINDDGTVTYTPNTGFTGTDTFTYTVEDTSDNVSSNFVTVTVSSGTLVAGNGTVSTSNDSAITVTVMNYVTYSAGSTVTVTSATNGSHGTVTLNDDGTVTYTPDSGYYGNDTFTYTVENNSSVYATGTITVAVGGGGFDDLVALDEYIATQPNTADSTNAVSDTLYTSGDSVSLISVTQGTHGSVTTSGNTVTYTPNAGFCGTDTFTYTVKDAAGNVSTATVTEFVDSATLLAASAINQDPGLVRSFNKYSLYAQAYTLQLAMDALGASGEAIAQAYTYLNDLLQAAKDGKGPLAGNAAGIIYAEIFMVTLELAYDSLEAQVDSINEAYVVVWIDTVKLVGILELPSWLVTYQPPEFPPLP